MKIKTIDGVSGRLATISINGHEIQGIVMGTDRDGPANNIVIRVIDDKNGKEYKVECHMGDLVRIETI